MDSILDDFELVLSKSHRELTGIENNIKALNKSIDELDQVEYESFRNFMWRLATISRNNGLNCNSDFIRTPIKYSKNRNCCFAFTLFRDDSVYEHTYYYLTVYLTDSDNEILADNEIEKCGKTVEITKTHKDFWKQLGEKEREFYCEFMAMWDYVKENVETSFMKVATNDMACMLECAEDELDDLEYSREVVNERILAYHYDK